MIWDENLKSLFFTQKYKLKAPLTKFHLNVASMTYQSRKTVKLLNFEIFKAVLVF